MIRAEQLPLLYTLCIEDSDIDTTDNRANGSYHVSTHSCSLWIKYTYHSPKIALDFYFLRWVYLWKYTFEGYLTTEYMQ